MKFNYQIGEIAKIYNISTDTLRHYEKEGLLTPGRSDNGYRVYNLFDTWKLNIIQTMKSLGIQLKDIKEFLDNRSVKKEIDLLNEEYEYIIKQINSLENKKKNLKNRLEILASALKIDNFNEVEFVELPSRTVIYIDGNISGDNEVDFAYSHLSNIERDAIHFFNRDFGVMLNVANIQKNRFNNYDKAFLIVSEEREKFGGIIEGGKYAIIRFKGKYSNAKESYNILFDKMEEMGLKYENYVIERYVIDINQTSNEDEYITEIQLKILS